jgi:hypothetical protein
MWLIKKNNKGKQISYRLRENPTKAAFLKILSGAEFSTTPK